MAVERNEDEQGLGRRHHAPNCMNRKLLDDAVDRRSEHLRQLPQMAARKVVGSGNSNEDLLGLLGNLATASSRATLWRSPLPLVPVSKTILATTKSELG
jgi:hypothetical protein